MDRKRLISFWLLDTVDGFTYYVRPEGDAAPVVRWRGARQELLVPVRFRNGEATVSYGILW